MSIFLRRVMQLVYLNVPACFTQLMHVTRHRIIRAVPPIKVLPFVVDMLEQLTTALNGATLSDCSREPTHILLD